MLAGSTGPLHSECRPLQEPEQIIAALQVRPEAHGYNGSGHWYTFTVRGRSDSPRELSVDPRQCVHVCFSPVSHLSMRVCIALRFTAVATAPAVRFWRT